MLKKIILIVLLFSFTFSYTQQKRSLTHDDYDLWKNIGSPQITDNGQLVVTTVSTATGRGDGYLSIYNSKTGKTIKFHNGQRAQISNDNNYIVFFQKPDYELVRFEKKKKLKKDEMSKNKLFIYDVRLNRIVDSVLRVKSFDIPKKYDNWLIIEKFKDLKPKKDTTETKKDSIKEPKEKKKGAKKKKNPALESDYALVYNLKNRISDTIFHIKSFQLAEEAQALFFTKTKPKKKGDLGVFKYDFENGAEKVIDTGRYAYDRLAIDKKGTRLAYLSAKDSVSKDSLKYELFYVVNNAKKQVTDTLGKGLLKGWELSAAQTPYFSKNSKRLYFYSKPEVKFNIDTTLLKEEIPEVDVWNYKDKLIQPEQKSKLKALKDKAYLSFLDLENDKIIQLHDESLENVMLDQDREQKYILGSTSSPYDVSRSWDYPWLSDYYIINTETGEKELALKGAVRRPTLSPDGNYAVYFDSKSQHWWALNLTNNQKNNLTEGLGVPFYDVEDDHPAAPGSYGFGGFDKEGFALLNDQFDIWKVDLSGVKKPINITKDGRTKNIEYRALRLDYEKRNEVTYYKNMWLIDAFDKTNKTNTLYGLNPKNYRKKIILNAGNMILGGFVKAKEKDILLYEKEDFQTFPDLYYFDGRKSKKITDANPQQKDFLWGTSEKFSWTAYDGTKLDGIIYKPENFDATKKYPMISYFYEKRSDNLNSYHMPRPSASTVNMSYLVSNGYVVFVPDIVYKDGKPGESAYNCIVSGVEAVEKLGYVDSDNMAIQGQSWGGYQVAYLVTKTNKFKAAMAGAPVANMTSAYGGIRWQSGLSRAFQYEKTQSRIGKNLWDGFDLYIENSPLFGIPNIETPLLIMHNDADGAVPYYQGIEMFMGMRRLNKPVWLLVYNDEAHNLRKQKNRQDLSIRMMQFFDHYLKGAPAPKWMTQGVSQVRKGKDFGYELEKL
ncbi:S9 family peptidase [Aureibaculum marinum]|uniref:S9 family peptidase n=1 Tax=Aureibaculum marinum TaxID=2487930 RepID=A0A3N4P170_9FLAO|nr:prolyl oligopeptidase family serine peptidase [Aureibaculum marinum]RPE00898.1 S9 family peptidase [Aureibaculum marinum]